MLELGSIIILGIFAQWLAWRIKVPAILPLIIVGLLVGPFSTFWTPDHYKFIEPIYNPETGKGLFPNQYLFYFVSLSIGIILFEGGLTLKRSEISDVGPSIVKLISLGSLITFIGAGFAARFVLDLSWSISFLFASLIIVTGPTVIAPILQNVPLNRNVATVLKWEGILIDPIGALVAVLMYEFIISSDGLEFTFHAFKQFFIIIAVGVSLGLAAAYGLYYMLKKNHIPHFLLNVFTLAMVLTVFELSDFVAHESGLLTVVVFGMVLTNLEVPNIKEILYFKESISVLLISVLFILLAANIDLSDLELIYNWKSLVLFAIIVLILRPIGVFASTAGSESLNLNEKLFISWVGPRGIVAAGIASLFGIRLAADGVPYAEYITPLVFMIVLGTVLLNATLAKPIASLLGVTQSSSNGILIFGAHHFSRLIAQYLQDNNRHVVLVDSNLSNIKSAEELGLKAIQANIYTDNLDEEFELTDMGYMLAFTGSSDVNNYALTRYQKVFGEHGSYRLITPREMRGSKDNLPLTSIFSQHNDFINISEVARDYSEILELSVSSKTELIFLLDNMSMLNKTIPLFLKDLDGAMHVINSVGDMDKIQEGWKLVYLGKKYVEDKTLTQAKENA